MLPILNDANEACLLAHNNAREGYSEPVVWNYDLAILAQSIADSSPTGHSGTAGGENLYWSSGNPSCVQAVNLWMSEKNNYNGERIGEGNFGSYGHYTQIMWKPVTSIGCGMSTGVVVCKYDQIQYSGVAL